MIKRRTSEELKQLRSERSKLLDQAVLGFGLDEFQSLRLDRIETQLSAADKAEKVGRHFCPDWDEMELIPGMDEFACCTCSPKEKTNG